MFYLYQNSVKNLTFKITDPWINRKKKPIKKKKAASPKKKAASTQDKIETMFERKTSAPPTVTVTTAGGHSLTGTPVGTNGLYLGKNILNIQIPTQKKNKTKKDRLCLCLFLYGHNETLVLSLFNKYSLHLGCIYNLLISARYDAWPRSDRQRAREGIIVQ